MSAAKGEARDAKNEEEYLLVPVALLLVIIRAQSEACWVSVLSKGHVQVPPSFGSTFAIG